MNKTVLLVLACALGVLAGCSAEHDDLSGWMARTAEGMNGQIDPLPEMQTFPLVSYIAMSEVAPFSHARIAPEASTASSGGPDLERPREPLEAYPLESLAMVGVLERAGQTHALMRVDGVLHPMRVGQYMGQDHGVIVGISHAAVELVEIVEDVHGEWVERSSRLRLQEH